MEVVQDPTVLNSLVLNVHRISKSIKDVEFIFDTQQKKQLIFLELSWWGRTFRERKILESVENMLDHALPSFQKRITLNREIFEKALQIVESRNNAKTGNIRTTRSNQDDQG